MKSDLKRRLEALESVHPPLCPQCDYLAERMGTFSSGQLYVLRAILMGVRDASLPSTKYEISPEEEAELVDFFENLPELKPACTKCWRVMEREDEPQA
ncbi:hypothetical protein [Methanothrix harundinacea]|uniref:hypothetical protein n=1 Tax=Methanothrix harundinacea TaxID=301375 RepID=UPI00117CEA46|nr:hypothetical protein [Methanothrix harundinacea]